jgi:hypothetical protein
VAMIGGTGRFRVYFLLLGSVFGVDRRGVANDHRLMAMS